MTASGYRVGPAADPDPRWQGLQIVARGTTRLCAQDPARPLTCLKFELPVDQRPPTGWRGRLRRWTARRFPHFDDNHTEWRAWQWLYQRLGDPLQGRMARCDGLLDTRWGQALACECIHDADGSIARSLYAHLFDHSPHPREALVAAAEDFIDWLLRHDVPLFDLNAGNLVVVASESRTRLVCVDPKSVLSGKEIIPVSRWSRRLMHRKILRRGARLIERIRQAPGAAPALAEPARPH